MGKPQLAILSDLFGDIEAEYLDNYVKELDSHFDVSLLSSKLIAQIPDTIVSQDAIHREFINGGIDQAVTHIAKGQYQALIGLSIGGVIAYKYSLKLSSPVDYLVCVSSTRLRYELIRPTCPTKLYFGAGDPYLPSDDWLGHIAKGIKLNILNDGHQLYKNQAYIRLICKDLIDNMSF